MFRFGEDFPVILVLHYAYTIDKFWKNDWRPSFKQFLVEPIEIRDSD